MFNSQFEPYLGLISGTELKALVSKIIANNSQNPGCIVSFVLKESINGSTDSDATIHSLSNTGIGKLNNALNKIKSDITYKVAVSPSCSLFQNKPRL